MLRASRAKTIAPTNKARPKRICRGWKAEGEEVATGGGVAVGALVGTTVEVAVGAAVAVGAIVGDVSGVIAAGGGNNEGGSIHTRK
jgi:hypothetical protein